MDFLQKLTSKRVKNVTFIFRKSSLLAAAALKERHSAFAPAVTGTGATQSQNCGHLWKHSQSYVSDAQIFTQTGAPCVRADRATVRELYEQIYPHCQSGLDVQTLKTSATPPPPRSPLTAAIGILLLWFLLSIRPLCHTSLFIPYCDLYHSMELISISYSFPTCSVTLLLDMGVQTSGKDGQIWSGEKAWEPEFFEPL